MATPPLERRRDVRAAVSIMATVEDGQSEQPIVLLNLSASGAMIQAHEAPRDEAQYHLCFCIQNQPYEVGFEVVHWLQQGDTFGWRGRFAGVAPEESAAIRRAVHAVAGISRGELRTWGEVSVEAAREPAAKVLVGSTPAGRDIQVLGQDVLEMGAEGIELYARLMCELETL
jgi:PilZ domain-containing protein